MTPDQIKTDNLGLVWLQEGDVVELDKSLFMVVMTNQSRAACESLAATSNTFVTGFDPESGKPISKTITGKRARTSIAARVDPDIVKERRGRKGYQDFQAGKATRRSGRTNGGQDSNAENSMNNAKARGGLAAEAQEEKRTKPLAEGTTSKGKLGELMGCSVVSVLRRLGKEGVTVGHARAIMKAQKIKASDATVQIQIGKGRNKDGEVANLTQVQVKELKDSAEEPAAEPAKPKGKGKGGKGKGATAATATEPKAAEAPAAA